MSCTSIWSGKTLGRVPVHLRRAEPDVALKALLADAADGHNHLPIIKEASTLNGEIANTNDSGTRTCKGTSQAMECGDTRRADFRLRIERRKGAT